MNTVKKAAFITAAAGGILAAGMGAANASSDADGAAVGSPGVVSGNNIQVPVHVPLNLCGNSVNIVGLVNPAFGNVCLNQG
ncbi:MULTISPECIES: chaplin [unclassified Embleya]|uniref:chaplin n=1 Tax=unclassified Embleya TaxID=2699296 RepID=UPI0033FCBF50